MSLMFVLLLIVSYLLGSIPFGYIAGRIAGIDVRNSGSGNIGATNVMRTLGRHYGYAVFALDFLKGLAAVRLTTVIEGTPSAPGWPKFAAIAAAVLCVIGHSFPIWLGFKGGKGVATSAGALFGLIPGALVVAAVVWLLTFQVTRYVSLASMVSSIAVPITIAVLIWLGHSDSYALFYFSLCLAALVIVRHRTNLSRLVHGTEPRFNRK